tara:strand:+ start:61060 stop:62406 length:1347 start_codon:yes stop_codon:yes gene_type:complete
MKTTYLLLLLSLLGCGSPPAAYDLIITNVHLIDGTGEASQPNVHVYIKNNKIVAIDSGAVKSGSKIINGTGKYLIPGLFDAHAHTSDYENDFPKFVHFGVTSIFCPGGSKTTNDYFANMRAMGEQDSIPAPRVFHTSQHFTMEGRHPAKTYAQSNWIEGASIFYLKDTLQIERLVAQVSKFPITGIKLTIEDGPEPPFVERMPQVFINKVATEAKKNGTEVFAHVSDNTELAMAFKAGIRNIIHYTGVDLDFEKDSTLLAAIYSEPLSWVTTLMIDKSLMYAMYPDWATTIEQINLFDPKEVQMLRDSMTIERAKGYLNMLENDFGIKDANYENTLIPYVEEIKILYKNGVNMVLGTDTGNTFIFPGYSLHEEMQILELGGMAPLDILKMGTHNAAKMLHVLDTHGTLEVGKYADMILLDKNPLEAIKNTLAIQTVIKNGKVQQRMDE